MFTDLSAVPSPVNMKLEIVAVVRANIISTSQCLGCHPCSSLPLERSSIGTEKELDVRGVWILLAKTDAVRKRMTYGPSERGMLYNGRGGVLSCFHSSVFAQEPLVRFCCL